MRYDRLTLSLLEKLKNTIFEIPIVLQTLKIYNYRTASAKPVNLDIIRKFIKCFLKNVTMKTMFYLTVLEILLFKGRSVLGPALWVPRSERVTFLVINQQYVWILLELLEKSLPYKLRRFRIVFNFFDFA